MSGGCQTQKRNTKKGIISVYVTCAEKNIKQDLGTLVLVPALTLCVTLVVPPLDLGAHLGNAAQW